MAKRSRDLFKDKEHLVRMAGIFAIGIVLFLGLQQLLIPDTFGLYGHYRAAAIAEAAARAPVYAGRDACRACHAAAVEAKLAGKHARVGCEACHGPLAAHARNPRTARAPKPDSKRLCPACHAALAGRPAELKQVNVQEHSSGEACNSCHQPHAPQM